MKATTLLNRAVKKMDEAHDLFLKAENNITKQKASVLKDTKEYFDTISKTLPNEANKINMLITKIK